MTTQPKFTQLTNLAATRLGAQVMYATDDFFADKSRLIDPNPPVWIEDKYDEHGKWMDGWESRRRRVPGHDFAVIKLGRSGRIFGFEVDTAHFTGNYPPFTSIDAALTDADMPADDEWHTITAKSALKGDCQNFFAVDNSQIWSHIRLHIYPDGGVARLRVYGRVFMDWAHFDRTKTIDLAALEYGGTALYASDSHYGAPNNLIAPGKGTYMGDGWETRRRPDRASDPDYWTKAHDFCIVHLARKGEVARIVLDTAFFKGNYPDRASVQAADCSVVANADIIKHSQNWPELLPAQKLAMDRELTFIDAINALGPITHVRLNIYPDGGVSRLRVFGKITAE